MDTVMTEADVSRLVNERNHYRLTLMRLTAESEGTPLTLIGLEGYDPLELTESLPQLWGEP